MITANMVPPNIYIEKLAEYVKNNVKEVQPPAWSFFAKTASFKERVPDDVENWWYIRTASLLRKLYVYDSLGLNKSKTVYGGLKRRGSEPPRSVKAPAHSTRLIFQQLEKAGLVIKSNDGRKLSPKGRSILDKVAREIFIELSNQNTSLKKYLE